LVLKSKNRGDKYMIISQLSIAPVGEGTSLSEFVKIVINENFLPSELDTACQIIARVSKEIPLVIQPVFDSRIPDILNLQLRAMTLLSDVRIIPQVHKYLHLK